jgi:hypothetical protein
MAAGDWFLPSFSQDPKLGKNYSYPLFYEPVMDNDINTKKVIGVDVSG